MGPQGRNTMPAELVSQTGAQGQGVQHQFHQFTPKADLATILRSLSREHTTIIVYRPCRL